MKGLKNILISRTDSIGDVVLTLPMAAILKKHYPHVHLAFMGKSYTRPVIEACEYVDSFVDVNDFLNEKITIAGRKIDAIIHVLPVPAIAKRAHLLRIPVRVGTTNRIYHLISCNKLVKLTRKKSLLHEAQLNLKLLEPFDINETYTLDEISKLFGLRKLEELDMRYEQLVDKHKYNLIIHPKSQGSAREWGLDNFVTLIESINLSRYKVFISGTKKERQAAQPLFDKVGDVVTDICGQLDLRQFISFIDACDGIIANSTGPLHIGAALGKDAYGIYPPIKPMHAGRWAPVGSNAHIFTLHKSCEDCKANAMMCHCIKEISPGLVKAELDHVAKHNYELQ